MKHWKNHAKSKKKKRVLKRNDFRDMYLIAKHIANRDHLFFV